ncbi:MAG: WecB/TagA/CpsF family glycosyltransferase [Gammaproteobacteria bacterium]|nr:WecB/TagA/CpsF family glycosyltransferase [Gammaproteobacteria bacterium]
MTNPPQAFDFFGAPVHPWTMDATVAEIRRRLSTGEFTQHVVVNVAKIVHMQEDKKLAESVSACDIVNIDGMGVVWGARFLGHEVPERVAGIDLFERLLQLASETGDSVFFLGAEDAIVRRMADVLGAKYPALKIAGFHHGYFWDDEEAVVDKIRESGAKLLFVAITSPKKENFINRWKERLGVVFVMGVGGTFDIMAGKTQRAPLWMQKAGLEWLYRVLQEPGRMWKRYFSTNLAFAWMLLKHKFKA